MEIDPKIQKIDIQSLRSYSLSTNVLTPRKANLGGFRCVTCFYCSPGYHTHRIKAYEKGLEAKLTA